MLAFAAVMGGGQVLAGGERGRAQRVTVWMLGVGLLVLVAGILVFVVVD